MFFFHIVPRDIKEIPLVYLAFHCLVQYGRSKKYEKRWRNRFVITQSNNERLKWGS